MSNGIQMLNTINLFIPNLIYDDIFYNAFDEFN